MSTLQQHRDSARPFRHGDHDTVFWDSGLRNAPALLLIHGFPTASRDWHRIEPALARGQRVIAADLIGFGYSDKPRAHRYSVFDYADQLGALLRALQLREVDVLAHDLGDTVAQELLARQLEAHTGTPRLRSVALLNGGLFPDHHRPRPIQRLLAGPLGPLLVRLLDERAFRRSFSAVFGPATRPDAATLDECWQQIAHNDGARIAHRLLHYIAERRTHAARWSAALQSTTVPLLLIDGLADPVSGAHLVQAFRARVPQAACVGLPQIGHYPQLEAPAAVLQAYLEWRVAIGF